MIPGRSTRRERSPPNKHPPGLLDIRAAGFRRPFCWAKPRFPLREPNILRCNNLNAAMQTNEWLLASGIPKLPVANTAAISCNPTREQNVQDCLPRRRVFRHSVWPLHGHYRSPADGERPHCHSQRRASLFRSLSPRTRCGAALAPPPAWCLPSTSPTWTPVFPGSFFARKTSQPPANSSSANPTFCLSRTL